jgi:hypothetical protein
VTLISRLREYLLHNFWLPKSMYNYLCTKSLNTFFVMCGHVHPCQAYLPTYNASRAWRYCGGDGSIDTSPSFRLFDLLVECPCVATGSIIILSEHENIMYGKIHVYKKYIKFSLFLRFDKDIVRHSIHRKQWPNYSCLINQDLLLDPVLDTSVQHR